MSLKFNIKNLITIIISINKNILRANYTSIIFANKINLIFATVEQFLITRDAAAVLGRASAFTAATPNGWKASITLEELGRLIGMLHQSALVIASVPGQGKQLLKLRWERKKREFWGALSNVLAIRFKGLDP